MCRHRVHILSSGAQPGHGDGGGPRVPNIPRATRVGNLKKLISAVVRGLQSRFVFAFSDLFSHVGPFRIRCIRDTRSRAQFVVEFDLSNRIAFNVNMSSIKLYLATNVAWEGKFAARTFIAYLLTNVNSA